MVTLHAAEPIGLDAAIITVEVDLSPGLHLFSIVGLADKEVQESRERIGVAIRNIGARPPHKKSERLIVNLAPADIRKEGPLFDLPIALAYLLASGQARFDPAGSLFVGELGLDGSIKPVAGVLPMAIIARLAGFRSFYVPRGNGIEAALIDGITVREAGHLQELLDDLEGRRTIAPTPRADIPAEYPEPDIDFAHIRGQEQAKRAIEIAAAGGHNVLLQGPPGTGKTLLARASAGVLPALTEDERIEVTKIASVAGALKHRHELVTTRPFRSPHHTASAVAITGGGSPIRPGEVTMAHRGVLFLDEFPEFPGHVLESLRQPLEDKVITVARANASVRFPADFVLIAAMNPCPCGNLTNPQSPCVCTPGVIAKYQRRVSGPLLDRIDLAIEVGPVDVAKLDAPEAAGAEWSAAVRERVEQARSRQRARYRALASATNASLGLRELKTHCALDDASREILRRAYERFHMSARSYYRTVKVARTIADLAGAERIAAPHILEALQYRPGVER